MKENYWKSRKLGWYFLKFQPFKIVIRCLGNYRCLHTKKLELLNSRDFTS